MRNSETGYKASALQASVKPDISKSVGKFVALLHHNPSSCKNAMQLGGNSKPLASPWGRTEKTGPYVYCCKFFRALSREWPLSSVLEC